MEVLTVKMTGSLLKLHRTTIKLGHFWLGLVPETEHLLVVLDVLIETTKLSSLKDAERNKENDAKDEWIDTTQDQVLHLKVTTCNNTAPHSGLY